MTNMKSQIIKLSIFIALLNISISSYGSNKLPADSLVSDFRYFCKILETSHPDPYTSFGGRPYFCLTRDSVADKMAKDSLTVEDFCNLLNEFIMPLHDMHTFIQYPSSSVNDIQYVQRIAFTVLHDGLMVSGISKPFAKYLGSNLLSIGGVSLDSLAHRMTKLKAHENSFDNLQNISIWGNQDVILKKLGVNFDDHVLYQLKTAQGDTIQLHLPLVDSNHLKDVEMVSLQSALKLPDRNLQYAFLDTSKNVMYFRLSSVMARENYRYCYDRQWPDALNDIASYYQSIGKKMPANVEEAINHIPSFSEEFSNLLKRMKEHNSANLIIDLRGNDGGWTPITLPSLMMMFGDEYFGKDFDVKNIRLISDLYLGKMNLSIDQLNQSWDTQLKTGDYFVMNENSDEELSKKRSRMIQNAMTETPDLLASLNGKPLYRPKRIFVITNSWTFSAAFHYAFYLAKMGAEVVGVPSGQAPNTFMEVTPFKLPYTGLTGSISNTMQQFFPVDSPLSKVLQTDIDVTLQDYHHFGNDANTPVLKILECCD